MVFPQGLQESSAVSVGGTFSIKSIGTFGILKEWGFELRCPMIPSHSDQLTDRSYSSQLPPLVYGSLYLFWFWLHFFLQLEMVSKIDLASSYLQTLRLTVNKFQPKRRLQVEKRSEVTHDSWSPKFLFFANLAPTIFVSDFYHVLMLISSFLQLSSICWDI